MEAALRKLLPRLVGLQVTYRIHNFGGKQRLLRELPKRLRGYSTWAEAAGYRIVVLVDEDREDCRALKQRMDAACAEAGLATKSSVPDGAEFLVLNRIVVEELEAWLLGDVDAVRAAYPRVSDSLGRRAGFRNPDTIVGGTWEQFERILQAAGYHRGGLAKMTAAAAVAEHMDPDRNRSRSFQSFVTGLEALLA